MNRRLLVTIGMACALLAGPLEEAKPATNLAMAGRRDPDFRFERRPDFIHLDDYGISVSWGAPYDVVYLDDAYFIFRNGSWYRARDYRGPWSRIRDNALPGSLKNRSWREIERRRNDEYRRHGRSYWDDRFRRERDYRPERGTPPPARRY
jgi:hypothetical protein